MSWTNWTVAQDEFYEILPCGGIVVILERETENFGGISVNECDYALYGPELPAK